MSPLTGSAGYFWVRNTHEHHCFMGGARRFWVQCGRLKPVNYALLTGCMTAQSAFPDQVTRSDFADGLGWPPLFSKLYRNTVDTGRTVNYLVAWKVADQIPGCAYDYGTQPKLQAWKRHVVRQAENFGAAGWLSTWVGGRTSMCDGITRRNHAHLAPQALRRSLHVRRVVNGGP
jgi:hypothetical protein